MNADADADGDRDRDGFRDGLESSEGDPRVLLALNAILSAMFGWLLVRGLGSLGFLEYTPTNVAIGAVGLFVLTYVVTRS